MKRAFQSAIMTAFVLVLSTASFAQSTGLKLYSEMGERSFLGVEGNTRMAWLPGSMGYLETERNDDETTEFFKIDPKSEKRTPLFDANTQKALVDQYNKATGESVNGLPFSNFDFVMDNDAIFFTVKDEDFVFNLKGKSLRMMNVPEVPIEPYTDELMRGMQFSQLWNGSYSHDYKLFAYIKDYNIIVVDTETGEERQVTHDGNHELMNGRPSWVYPEEFGQREAYWFSPDNSKIAYMQYNETEVYDYPIIHEMEFEAGLELEKYPKAGEPNPTVNLFVVDLNTGEIDQVPTNSNADTYIVRPIWRNDGSELTFRRMNRKQDHIELLAYDVKAKKVRTVLEEREDTYIRLHDNFIQMDDNKSFIWTSEVSGYNHIYHYGFDGKLIAQVTKGDFPVSSIENIDQKNKKIYFTAFQNMGLDRYFYVVDFDGKRMKQLNKEDGRHSISMSPDAKYYIDNFSSFDRPFEANLYTADGKVVRNLMKTDVSKVKENKLQKPEVFNFKAADGETELVGLIYKPVDFDPNKKYPVVLPLYGGPGSQDVSNTYKDADSYQRLAQLGFIVVRANYRGSGNRGKEFQALNYGKLGTVEIDDYAEAIETVTARSYADGSRVGVYGHSYGGYSTSMLLLRYPDLFQVGIAGAPVTDWRSYDTIYTERYMNTPQANPEGYENASAMKYAENLKGKLLLVHGTIDNNVHKGNTVMLQSALIKADKRFDLMTYPENRHGIRGDYGRHYSKLRLNYLIENLKPEIEKNTEVDADLTWSN